MTSPGEVPARSARAGISPSQLTITFGETPDSIVSAKVRWPGIEIGDDEILVRFGPEARLLVSGGSRMVVQVPEDADWDGDPAWIVQGWGVTLAALQCGQLSLHAATVDVGGRVVAVAGERGAGKSTTAMGLRARGHRLLVDDVALIEFRGDEAWTTPYARNVHLLPDAAEALGMDFASLPMLAGGRDKAAFEPEPPPLDARRIEAIAVLLPDPEVEEVLVSELRGAERVPGLINHTHRDGLAPLVLGEAEYFRALTRLAGAAPVFLVRRPDSSWTLDPVLDAVESVVGGAS